MTIDSIKLHIISKSFPYLMRDDVVEIVKIANKYLPHNLFLELMKSLEQGEPLDELKSGNVYFSKIKKTIFLYRDDYYYVIGKCGEKMHNVNYLGFLKEVLGYLS